MIVLKDGGSERPVANLLAAFYLSREIDIDYTRIFDRMIILI
jgi:hypothetical protein